VLGFIIYKLKYSLLIFAIDNESRHEHQPPNSDALPHVRLKLPRRRNIPPNISFRGHRKPWILYGGGKQPCNPNIRDYPNGFRPNLLHIHIPTFYTLNKMNRYNLIFGAFF